MKRIIGIATFLILLGSSFMSLSADNPPSSDELKAIGTVSNYLDALMAGDTSGALQYLAPGVAEQRRAMFNNPNYPAQLQQAYANAQYVVTSSTVLSVSEIQVEVKITLRQQDTVHSRFVLTLHNNQFLISSEK